MKKIPALILALVLALSLTSCDTATNEDSSAASGESTPSSVQSSSTSDQTETLRTSLTLPYSAGDALSPVQLKSDLNDRLTPLLYDSLFWNNDAFQPVPSMAESFETTGRSCTVVLKSGLKFSDGTKVTGDDVAASFRALKSAPAWKTRLSGISSVSADNNRITFTMTAENSKGVCLLEFPVMRAETVTDAIPVGSGAYVAKKKGNDYQLTKNGNSAAGDNQIKSITLTTFPDSSAVFYAVKSSAVDFAAVSTEELSQNRGSYVSCNSLGLVYLGLNQRRSPLSDKTLRQILFCSVNRSALTSGAFGGLGTNSFFPLHPATQDYATARFDTAGFTAEQGETLAKELQKNGSGQLTLGGTAVSLSLLVNKENNNMTEAARLIQETLDQLGITVKLEQVTFATLKKRVAAGDYDLYLGEVHLQKDQSLSAFFGGTALLAGSGSATETKKTYTAYRNGTGELKAFLTAFSDEVPFVPLLFLQQVFMTSRQVDFTVTPTENNLFYGMEDWQK